MGEKTFGVRLRVKTISIPHWVKRGNMLIARDALDGNDPDHPYNWIRNTFGVRPEEFGIYPPLLPIRPRESFFYEF